MRPSRRLSPAALLALATLIAIPLSMAFADRPIASFMFAHLHDSRAAFALLTRLVDGVEFAGSLLLIWSVWHSLRGRPFGPKGQIALRTGLAVFVAIGAKDMLKLAFGRLWPETFVCGNPSFIRDAAYGFSPFHGGQGWASFPSGHVTVVCAAAGALWALAPRGRPLYALAAVLVAVGLLGADYHWLSDIFAGALVGWIIGVYVARLDLANA